MVKAHDIELVEKEQALERAHRDLCAQIAALGERVGELRKQLYYKYRYRFYSTASKISGRGAGATAIPVSMASDTPMAGMMLFTAADMTSTPAVAQPQRYDMCRQ